MASDQQFCLRWNNHQSTLVSVFDNLLESQTLVDCTLAADGQYLKAHKVVLSACSPYLEAILCQNLDKHPILILKDVKFSELKAMLDYMYRGEVNISQEQLSTFLKAAESLQIKGLTDSGGGGGGGGSESRERDLLKRQDLLRKPLNQPVPHIPQPRPVVPHPGLLEPRRSLPHFPPHIADMQPQSPRHAREGSTSPTARKRRRPNRPSSDDSNFVSTPNSLSENQPDTSDSCDLPVKQSAPSTPSNVPNPSTKAQETDSPRTTPQPQINSDQKQIVVKKEFPEALLTPKTELDYGNDNSMEDVNYEDDEDEEVDLSKPGTSFATNNQGFPPWQMGGDASNDDSNIYSPDVSASATQNNSQDASVSPKAIRNVNIPVKITEGSKRGFKNNTKKFDDDYSIKDEITTCDECDIEDSSIGTPQYTIEEGVHNLWNPEGEELLRLQLLDFTKGRLPEHHLQSSEDEESFKIIEKDFNKKINKNSSDFDQPENISPSSSVESCRGLFMDDDKFTLEPNRRRKNCTKKSSTSYLSQPGNSGTSSNDEGCRGLFVDDDELTLKENRRKQNCGKIRNTNNLSQPGNSSASSNDEGCRGLFVDDDELTLKANRRRKKYAKKRNTNYLSQPRKSSRSSCVEVCRGLFVDDNDLLLDGASDHNNKSLNLHNYKAKIDCNGQVLTNGASNGKVNKYKKEKNFKCKKCKISFNSKTKLDYHTKFVCGFPHKYECPLCKYKMKTALSVKHHAMRHHRAYGKIVEDDKVILTIK